MLEEKDADGGLNRLSQEPDIALLITDYAMPAITGVDFYRRAQAMRPGLGAILVTGFANLPADDEVLSSMHILRKPFDLPDIQRAVNQCLERVTLPEAA